jgi:hypothetical protein
MIESPIATTTGRFADEEGFVSGASKAGEHPASASIAPASTIAQARVRKEVMEAESTLAPYEDAEWSTIGLSHD